MNTVRSIDRAIAILEILSKGHARSLTELGELLSTPKSTIYQILATLVSARLADKDSAKRYKLGLRLLELAYTARGDLRVAQIARPVLMRLNTRLDETVQLSILDGDSLLYVDGYESSKALRTFFKLGDRGPLHCTGLGKAILAFLPKEQIAETIRRITLERFTKNTLTSRRALEEDLMTTAVRGYSVDNMEHEDGVRCVAAPIRDQHENPFASISVSGPQQRISPERDSEIAFHVVEAADEISRRMGYEPPTER